MIRGGLEPLNVFSSWDLYCPASTVSTSVNRKQMIKKDFGIDIDSSAPDNSYMPICNEPEAPRGRVSCAVAPPVPEERGCGPSVPGFAAWLGIRFPEIIARQQPSHAPCNGTLDASLGLAHRWTGSTRRRDNISTLMDATERPLPSPSSRSPSPIMARRWARKIERTCCACATYFPLIFVYGLTSWAVFVTVSLSSLSQSKVWWLGESALHLHLLPPASANGH
jgi:hypothetical protein